MFYAIILTARMGGRKWTSSKRFCSHLYLALNRIFLQGLVTSCKVIRTLSNLNQIGLIKNNNLHTKNVMHKLYISHTMSLTLQTKAYNTITPADVQRGALIEAVPLYQLDQMDSMKQSPEYTDTKRTRQALFWGANKHIECCCPALGWRTQYKHMLIAISYYPCDSECLFNFLFSCMFIYVFSALFNYFNPLFKKCLLLHWPHTATMWCKPFHTKFNVHCFSIFNKQNNNCFPTASISSIFWQQHDKKNWEKHWISITE